MKSMDSRAKKLLLFFAGIIVIIIVIFLIALIIGKLKNSSLSYNEIEDKMIEAAREYYSTNKDSLPLSDEEKNVEVSVSTLVEKGFLEELSSYQSDDTVICDGKVSVTKTGDYYDYSPYLDCGDAYRTIYLYEKTFDNIVESGDGLYKTTQYDKEKGNVTRYIYRGEYPNNYVTFGDSLWRIVKIKEDNSILLLEESIDVSSATASVWDNRYNTNTKGYDGIPDFDQSRLKRTLENYYNKAIFDDVKTKLVKITNCVGTRINADNKNDGSIECSKVAGSTFISVLPLYDYLNASLDSSCKRAIDMSCSNYNYLAKSSEAWWTLTINSKQNTTAYTVGGTPVREPLNTRVYKRLVINLSENTIYAGGEGTKANPYRIK